jgi:hypothetical protein
MGPNNITLEVLPELTGEAVITPVASATGVGDDRSGALPTAPFGTIPTHGVVNSIKSGRTKYDGVYHLIFKNLRDGNVNFFTYAELSAFKNEFEEYARYVKQFCAIQRRNDQRRMYDFVVANTNWDVQQCIADAVGMGLIHRIKLTPIVPVSVDTLLERKRSMYCKIARLLAAKAKKIVRNHRGFKSTFRYTATDSTQIEEYFIQRTLAEVDYLELRPAIRAMHTRAIAVQMAKQRRGAYDTASEYDSEPECEHCGHHECSGHCHLAERSRMRIAEFRRETGFGDDYDY